MHAGFGMGKTFFVTNWRKQIAHDRVVLHFDAWRSDYLESPLAGFVAAMREQLPDTDYVEQDALKRQVGRLAKKAAPLLLKGGIRVGLRLLSMGAIDGDIDLIKEAIVAEGLVTSSDISGEILEAFSESLTQGKLHSSLHAEFDKTIKLMSVSGKKVIIVIDELDRCRPDFTFALLEDIKHFLNSERACFFIFADEDVLHAQGSKIFGDKKSGEKYISKFFDLRLRLPDGDISKAAEAMLMEISRVDPQAAKYFGLFVGEFRLSIRQLRRVLGFVKLLFLADENLIKAWPVVLPLVVFREIRSDYYVKFSEELRVEIGKPSLMQVEFDNYFSAASTFLSAPTEDRFAVLVNKMSDDIRTRLFVTLCEALGGFNDTTFYHTKKKLLERIEYFGSIEGI